MIHAFVLLFALQIPVDGAPQHEEAGLAALKTGNRHFAIEELKRAADLDPASAQISLELGVAYSQNHNYGEAIPRLRKALELDPASTLAHQSLGYVLLAQGYAAEALQQFQLANDQAGLGIAQLETGDLPNAVRNLQAAVEAQPNNSDLLYYLARASGLLSKQVYDLLITTAPDSPRAHQALAENYAALRQTQQAADQYQVALRERPDLPGAYLALGQVYATASQWKQAEDAFREQCGLQPGNAEAAYRVGTALLQDGDAHGAREELARANQLQPDMPETLYSLGKAESQLGNYAAAEKVWKRVLELEHSSELASQAHFGLSGIYRRQGRTADAARELKLFQETHKTATQP